jgi:hypothetical protein
MAVVAVLSLACLAPAVYAQVERSEHFPLEYQQGMIEATVRVHVRTRGAWSQGTAVCIGHDRKYSYLLSSAHIFKGAKGEAHFEVFTTKTYPRPWRTYRPAWVTWWNVHNDIVVIRAAINVPRQIHIYPRGTIVAPGTPVLVVGCGLGAAPVCQVAKVTGLADNGDYVYDRGSIGGRSGAAVVSREHGLIGINQGGRTDVSYAVHYSKIHRLLAASPLGWGKLIPAKSHRWELSADEKAVLALVNQARAEKNLRPLAADPVLVEAARAHAASTARQDRFTTPVYPAPWNGNFHEGQVQPKLALEGWLALPPTRDNILNKDFRAVGVGLGRSAQGKSYYTLMFSTASAIVPARRKPGRQRSGRSAAR